MTASNNISKINYPHNFVSGEEYYDMQTEYCIGCGGFRISGWKDQCYDNNIDWNLINPLNCKIAKKQSIIFKERKFNKKDKKSLCSIIFEIWRELNGTGLKNSTN